MIDPFFFDRLMHAFTVTGSTPLSQAADHAETRKCAPHSVSGASACRAVREAEAVAAAAFRRDHSTHAGTPQADRDV